MNGASLRRDSAQRPWLQKERLLRDPRPAELPTKLADDESDTIVTALGSSLTDNKAEATGRERDWRLGRYRS